jgi:hypothetical protein
MESRAEGPRVNARPPAIRIHAQAAKHTIQARPAKRGSLTALLPECYLLPTGVRPIFWSRNG